MPNLNMFFNLPMPVKAGILLASGGGIIMLLFMLMQSNVLPPVVGYLVLVVLALAAAAGGAWKLISKKLEKRKGKPFEQKLAESSAAAPQGVSDPGSRAKLDDLRKRFDEGIQVFKDHGKDLYTMPWYVIVGEPGSGKTEAMRHSNVGFPPGLQNQLQGVGGTVNMHWWFTNEAVMIDTAGRLMFEEVEPGQTSEWNEFLKMLRIARPNCPLNGMLLVIPADSLIKDTANDIDRKGSKIAQQLDQIQRALGVRFPVYILISKADRINGFREFFDELTDPVAAMQMMGWSNPNDLDTAFDPSMVEQHLKTVRDRLVRRRFSLLSNPVHTEDPMGRRIDQVDALYAFPDSLVKLAPRLRRYLEMVFVAGEWSQKPLFLRGIYFTSSMREGDALDADLADVLGVQVDALIEGKLWERERSYFLKDVFKEKMFRERGLVTRETNVGKSRRRQSMILMAAAAVVALVIGGWTWFSVRELKQSVAGYAEFWKALADDISVERVKEGDWDKNWHSLVVENPDKGSWDYRDGVDAWALKFKWSLDGKQMGAGSERDRRVDMQETALAHAARIRSTGGTPLIFRVAGALTTDLPQRLPEAQRALFESKVVWGFVRSGRMQMNEGLEPKEWNRSALEALASLVEMQSIGLPGGPGSGEAAPAYERWIKSLGFRGGEGEAPFQWDPTDADWKSSDPYWVKLTAPGDTGTHAQRLATIFDQTYRTSSGAVDIEGLTAALELDAAPADPAVDPGHAVDAGVKSFIAAGGLREGSGGLLTQLQAFNAAAAEYVRAEAALGAFDGFKSVKTREEFRGARDRWVSQVSELETKKKAIDAVLYGSDGNLTEIGRFLTQTAAENLQGEMSKRASQDITDSFGMLLEKIPVVDAAEVRPEKLKERAEVLTRLRGDLEKARDTLSSQVAEQVAMGFGETPSRDRAAVLAMQPGSAEPAYVKRFGAIAAVAAVVREEPVVAGVDIFSLASEVESLNQRVAAAPASAGVASCVDACASYARYGEAQLVNQTLDTLNNAGTIGSLVRDRRTGAEARLGLRGLPMVMNLEVDGDVLDPEFDAEVAKSLFQSQAALEAYFRAGGKELLDATTLSALFEQARRDLSEYREQYADYWMQTVPTKFTVSVGSGGDAWDGWGRSMRGSLPQDACNELLKATRLVLDAMVGLPMADDSEEASFVAALKRDELDLAPRGDLRNKAQQVWDNWHDLVESGSTISALDKLRQNMRPNMMAQFIEGYLATARSGETDLTPARRYWQTFVRSGLNSLNSSYLEQSNADLRTIKTSAKGVPLVRGGGVGRQLTRDEVRQVGETVKRLLGSADTAPDGAQGQINLPSLPDDIRRLLTDLSSGQGRLSDEQRQWLEALRKITDALGAGSSPRVTIVFPKVDGVPTPHPNKAFWDDDGTYARVERGGVPFGSGGYVINIGEESKLIAERGLPDTGEPIVVKFFATLNAFENGNQPFTQGEIPAAWNGLQLWLQTNYAPGPEPRMIEGYTLVEIARDRQGNPFYLGVKLPEGLPAWEEWPSLDTWPE